MPKVFVSRSRVIQKSVGEMFALVRGFESWPRWSPWLVSAPGYELEFHDDGYSWVGEVCGKGTMKVVGEVRNESISYELTIVKPHPSKATVTMAFVEKDGGTEVTWTLESALPFFLFWMKRSLQGFLGMDYERGLLMLKDLAETGWVPSRVEFPGLEGCAPFVMVGIQRKVSMDGFEGQMEADYRKVREHYPEGEGMSIYDEWSLSKRRITYATGVKLEKTPGVVADGMKLFHMPGCDVYTAKHFGDYRHLGNGWAGGMMHLRAKRLKASKKIKPFEVYEEEAGADSMVRICLPLQ